LRGLSDYWFIKIDDTSGNLLWQKLGGNSIDHLTSAKETTDGYILGGSSSSGISGKKLKTQEETMIIG
jgi:hypothetical protein